MNSLRRGLSAAALAGALTVMFGCGSGPQQTNFNATITGPADVTASLSGSAGGFFGFPSVIFLVKNPDGTPVPNAEVKLVPASVGGVNCLVTAGATSLPAVCPASMTVAADNEGKAEVDFYVDTPACDPSCTPSDQTVSASVLGEIGANTALWTATITVKSCKDPSCP